MKDMHNLLIRIIGILFITLFNQINISQQTGIYPFTGVQDTPKLMMELFKLSYFESLLITLISAPFSSRSRRLSSFN